jgi:iron complex outermembrane recepter protein
MMVSCVYWLCTDSPRSVAMTFSRCRLFTLLCEFSIMRFAIAALSVGASLHASDAISRRPFNIAAGDATVALKAFAQQSGLQLLYSTKEIAGVRTEPVQGDFTPREALNAMIEGTDLFVIEGKASGTVAVRRFSDSNAPQRGDRPKKARDNKDFQAPPTKMKRKNPIAIFAGWLAVALGVAPGVSAQSASPVVSSGPTSLIGVVTNTATGRTLENARVVLKGTQRETLTDQQGVYRFNDVPAGPQQLEVSYTGLDTADVTAEIVPGNANRRDVGLTADIYTLGKYIVAGEREGNAEAITIQRHSTGVKTVVSTDAFGSLGANPADLIARLPGVHGETDGSAIRYVRIRGMNHVLNSITLDGNRLANGASAGSSREFQFTQIGADSIERIEVIKAPTPDMDADSIGGAVNLVSKSAFDREGRQLSGQIGAILRINEGAEEQHMEPTPSFSFSYSEVFKGKFGVSINYGDRKHFSPTPASSRNYEDKLADPAYTYAFGLEDYFHKQHRWGGGIKFDYRLNESSRFYANVTRNRMIEPALNHYTSYSTNQVVAARDAAGNLTGTGGIVPGYTRNVTEWRPVAASTVTATSSFEYKDVGALHLELGGVHKLTMSEIDYSVYESNSSTTYPHNDQVNITAAGIGIRIEESDDPNFPRLTQTAGPDITDPNSYTARRDLRVAQGKDRFQGVSLNFKQNIPAPVPVSVKAGLRVREQTRDLYADQFRWNYVGSDRMAGLNPATGINDDNLAQFVNPNIIRWAGTERYPLLPFSNWPDHGYNPNGEYRTGNNLERAVRENPNLFLEDVELRTRTALTNRLNFEETIKAGYVMGTIDLAKLQITGGIRVEQTDTEGEGSKNEVTPEELARRQAFTGPLTPEETIRRTVAQYGGRQRAAGDYREVFPHLHFKYNATRNLLIRASYSTNIGRPPIGQLIPNVAVDHVNRTLVISNPSLKPQYADNFDFGVEYYFEPVGMFSAGVFLKEIKQFIFSRGGNIVQGDTGEYAQYSGYTFTSQFNGGAAKVKGIELAYQQQLTFLPGIWSGLGIYANYSRNQTEGDYGGTFVTSKLAGFIPETANAGISYLRSPLSIRVQYNYAGRRLVGFSTSEARLAYERARGIWDIKTVFDINRHFALYFDVWNIFDEQELAQEFEGGRVGRNFRTGPQMLGGVNWRW